MWNGKCEVPHNGDPAVGNAQKIPNFHEEEEGQTAATKAIKSLVSNLFPTSVSKLHPRQASHSGVTAHRLTSFELPRMYVFNNWDSYSG